jgi:hypothetical protein
MAAKDPKGRTVLDDDQMTMVSVHLSVLRKTKPAGKLEDLNDVRDVLKALAIAGYAVVPQGLLDGLKKQLSDADI